MRVLSLFSGVGGFDLGLEEAGWKTVFQCEIDKHCRQTLDHHWPDVPRWDDVSTLTGRQILNDCDGVDVVAWGSPCQDLSVAGKRAGLSGERSGLFHQGIRIIKELRELTNGHGPVWSIWENVAGALSSNGGADFGQVLHEMDEAGACFSEWAVLDAQYFGVPQRRRRVFVVSCFDPSTADRCPDPLLPVGSSGSRDSTKGRSARETVTGEIAGGVGESCVVGTIGPTFGSKNYSNIQEVLQGSLVVEDVVAFSHTQGLDAEPSTVHTPTLRTKGSGAAVAYAFDNSYRDGIRIGDRDVIHTLQGHMGTGGNNVPFVATDAIPIQGTIIGRQDHNGPQGSGIGREGDPCFTLDSVSQHGVSHDMVVRRLTPMECERLMGWPDNHTLSRADGKTNSDSTRYKMSGNGVASPVAKWIATVLDRV